MEGAGSRLVILCGAVIPPFHSAVDKAVAYLDPVDGLLGVADFFVSGKHDLPMRQMNPLRRFFWRSPRPFFPPAHLFYFPQQLSTPPGVECLGK